MIISFKTSKDLNYLNIYDLLVFKSYLYFVYVVCVVKIPSSNVYF